MNLFKNKLYKELQIKADFQKESMISKLLISSASGHFSEKKEIYEKVNMLALFLPKNKKIIAQRAAEKLISGCQFQIIGEASKPLEDKPKSLPWKPTESKSSG